MVKGTHSMGKKAGKSKYVIRCRRCGKRSYHAKKKKCASCGFGRSKKLRHYSWQKKKSFPKVIKR
ncbi:50S ribosomal protein L37e [Candidatus Woesearchaeota archaeon]|nr:50S ribosomal protein L37e [Candidatus Woesearchaeota archaeon]